jgi:hypothetical protein
VGFEACISSSNGECYKIKNLLLFKNPANLKHIQSHHPQQFPKKPPIIIKNPKNSKI